MESPRLTLSEGNRNCLGLCIFLAMAKREADADTPLFLDDVVVSLDRNHRSGVIDVLTQEFADRQVIVLTHDRDWYTDLRFQLDGQNWIFRTLLPYEKPEVGIRWSQKTTTFDDARAQLVKRPDSAGNDARKIMDIELAAAAEKLRVVMPYLRGDRNDKRMAHDFLSTLISNAADHFKIKDGKDVKPYTEAIEAMRIADGLLLSWGNRGSHTFDLEKQEAKKLIDACELVMERFRCGECGRFVWYADAAASKVLQCHCGRLRWRYG